MNHKNQTNHSSDIISAIIGQQPKMQAQVVVEALGFNDDAFVSFGGEVVGVYR